MSIFQTFPTVRGKQFSQLLEHKTSLLKKVLNRQYSFALPATLQELELSNPGSELRLWGGLSGAIAWP